MTLRPKGDDVAIQLFCRLCDQYSQGVIDTSNISTLVKAFKLSQQPMKLCANESDKNLKKCLKQMLRSEYYKYRTK